MTNDDHIRHQEEQDAADREGWPAAIRRAIAAEAEAERLKGMLEGMAKRIADQSELLSRRCDQ